MNMQTAELKAAFQGALTSGAFGYVGDTWAGGTFGNYAGHALVGCASGAMNGGGGEGCARGAVSQVISKWVTLRTDTLGTAGQFAAATIAGGTTSAITGGKFATGAQTAAFGYLFNCLSHPGTCTKADQPEIRRAAAACGNDSACIQRIAIYARESGIPLPPDMAQSLKDFVDITTLPARILTPAGRLVDTGIDVLSATRSAINGTSDWISTVSGEAYEMFMERTLKPLNTELAGRAAAIWGKIFESVVGDVVKGQKPAGKDGKP